MNLSRQFRIIFIFFLSFAGMTGKIYSDTFSEKLQPGLRSNGEYRTWVYFTDKIPKQNAEGIINPAEPQLKTLQNQDQKANYFYVTPVLRTYVDQVQSTGVKIVHESRWFNAVSVLGTLNQIEAIASLPFVSSIDPVKQFRRPIEKPGSAMNRKLVSDSTFYGVSWAQLNQLNIPSVHDLGLKGSGVRILVLDTGFDKSHNVFTNLNVVGEFDFINSDTVTANETLEEIRIQQDRHGTVVLSVLAAYLPGQLVGAAYEAEYLLGKTEDVSDEYIGEEDNFVAGLEWGFANGANIMTASLGYIDWYSADDLDGETAITTKAVNIATSLGMSCVVSAGNAGKAGINAPSDAFNVLSVGAVNSSGFIANFSSRGPTFDGRIKPEVCARGVNTWAANPGSNSLSPYNGTSLAAPLISGGLALLKQAYPEMSVEALRTVILQNSSRAASPDNTYGWGIPDIYEAIGLEQPEHFKNKILAAPNPSVSDQDGLLELWFYSNTGTTGEVVVHTITGSKVLENQIKMVAGLNKTKIAIDGLSSGVYFVQLYAFDGGSSMKKMGVSKFTILK